MNALVFDDIVYEIVVFLLKLLSFSFLVPFLELTAELEQHLQVPVFDFFLELTTGRLYRVDEDTRNLTEEDLRVHADKNPCSGPHGAQSIYQEQRLQEDPCLQAAIWSQRRGLRLGPQVGQERRDQEPPLRARMLRPPEADD